MPRFTFRKNERLCSRKAIDVLFAKGRSFHAKNLRIIYLPTEAEQSPCQVLFIVPKKNFKRAVDRNLLKRRMREAYRLDKPVLYEKLVAAKKQLHIAILYTAKEIFEFTEIQASIKKALEVLLKEMVPDDRHS